MNMFIKMILFSSIAWALRLLRPVPFNSVQSVFGLFAISLLLPATQLVAADDIDEIYRKTGFKGGVIVHYGCEDGKETVAISRDGKFLVSALTKSADKMRKTRNHIDSKGLSGRLTAVIFSGKQLPYIDNSVNLFVASSLDDVSMAEVMRILTPCGAACIGSPGNYTITKKPWPDDIDEWTHYLHDATNNAVADDDKIGPPKHMQWTGGPRWTRHHDSVASMNAMVTGKGKLF